MFCAVYEWGKVEGANIRGLDEIAGGIMTAVIAQNFQKKACGGLEIGDPTILLERN
jgi:hypothetical protein